MIDSPSGASHRRGDMEPMRILFVDDSDLSRETMQGALENEHFEVVTAANVTEALALIVTQHFDVLLTDLQMPGPGDGLSVVTAMRHTQPKALILVLSGSPDVERAMAAIVVQADEILVKPFGAEQLAELIRKKTLGRKPSLKPTREGVAAILERDASITIERWMSRVRMRKELNCVVIDDEDRCLYLHEFLSDIIARLRDDREIEGGERSSSAAVAHGVLRRRLGYTAPMIVRESRILQVSIFETLQRNLGTVDFSSVLPDIMLIADEVDSQLTQSIDSFLKAEAVAAA
ncbi:MAG: response regulator [Terriglobales bacterium]